jgi:hypothetical protein
MSNDIRDWISFALALLGIYLQLRSPRTSPRKRASVRRWRAKFRSMEVESYRRDEDIQS